jgi:hypothetical protein
MELMRQIPRDVFRKHVPAARGRARMACGGAVRQTGAAVLQRNKHV